jgi:hypothetical protein
VKVGHGVTFLPALETLPPPLESVEQAVRTDGAASAAPPTAMERSRVRRDIEEPEPDT